MKLDNKTKKLLSESSVYDLLSLVSIVDISSHVFELKVPENPLSCRFIPDTYIVPATNFAKLKHMNAARVI